MRVTKHEHACLVIELGGKTLVIDPGNYTTPLVDLDAVAGIVITHEHADHWTPEQLQRILDRSPGARVLAPPSVAQLAGDEFEIEPTHDGQTIELDGFKLDFYGSDHAIIHSSIPVVENVGVMVGERLFYPGDAFTIPPVPVDTLAVPCSAPWLKVAEVMDYVLEIAPKRAFPVHEMLLSTLGKNSANGRIASVTRQVGGEFLVLEPEESLDL